MIRSSSLRLATASLLFAGLVSFPAHAANKDMIQLQTQVQQLQDAVANLTKTNDENIGMLKELVQQATDSINKMSVTVDGLKLSMQNQQDAIGTKDQQLSGQIQALNDSVDELKARMDRVQTTLGTIQSQQQTTNAALSNLPQPGGQPGGQPNGQPGGQPNGQTGGGLPAGNVPSTPNSNPGGALTNPEGIPAGNAPAGNAPPNDNAAAAPANAEPVPAPDAPAEPSAGDLYRGAYADYISAKYPLASSEFNDLIRAYPDDNLSGNAYFYLGEIDEHAQRPSAAIKNYDQVIERYPDNAKIPAAELHKAYAEINTHQITAGQRELRELIQRYPNSPEASQARAKLSTLRTRE